MKQQLGGALQAIALLVVGAGLVVGIAREDVRGELALLALGAVLFLAGRALAGDRGE